MRKSSCGSFRSLLVVDFPNSAFRILVLAYEYEIIGVDLHTIIRGDHSATLISALRDLQSCRFTSSEYNESIVVISDYLHACSVLKRRLLELKH